MVKRINDFRFIVSKPQTLLIKPLDIRKLSIISKDPIEVCIDMEMSNIDFRMIDDVQCLNNDSLCLISNFNLLIHVGDDSKINKLISCYLR